MADMKRRDLILTILISIALMTHLLPNGWRLDDMLGRQALADHNHRFLNEATVEAFETFVLLSAMKAGLAVMNSSSAGISFIVDMNVQIGQLVASTKEMVDTGWTVTVMGLSCLSGIRILHEVLDTFSLLFFHLFLVALLFKSSASLIWRRPPKWLMSSTQTLLILGMFLSFGIPLAISGLSLVSSAFTAPRAMEVRNQLQGHHERLAVKHDEDVKRQAHEGLMSYSRNAKSEKETHRHLSDQILQHIALMLFDGIIFPITFALAVWCGTRWSSRRVTEFFTQPDPDPEVYSLASLGEAS